MKRLGLDVSQGIKANFGIHVEFSTIANIAEVALRHAQSAKPPRVSLEVRKHLQCADADEQSVAERLSLFLKRVMRYGAWGMHAFPTTCPNPASCRLSRRAGVHGDRCALQAHSVRVKSWCTSV